MKIYGEWGEPTGRQTLLLLRARDALGLVGRRQSGDRAQSEESQREPHQQAATSLRLSCGQPHRDCVHGNLLESRSIHRQKVVAKDAAVTL